jgi:NADH:ubiquinone oxidoreductase subunit E
MSAAADLLDSLEHGLGISCGETTEDKRFDVDRGGLPRLLRAFTGVLIDRDIYSRMTVNQLTEFIEKL